ncbi:VOC family protein [Thauera butanivorans]|uniref:VOC family protein n=1 Tax=Thauera butanivorans TaxID=86174 RepID=UPI000838A8E9|nr:VOC family protein [Thauera butanivorans]
MPTPFVAGAVVYAKDVPRISTFYSELAGLSIAHSEPGYVVLESAGFQLVIVAIPAHIAASLEVTVPPQRRENTAIKLVLAVPSIARARLVAPSLGGGLNPAEREWQFQGSCVCDGHDPEGNVVQFRQNAL